MLVNLLVRRLDTFRHVDVRAISEDTVTISSACFFGVTQKHQHKPKKPTWNRKRHAINYMEINVMVSALIRGFTVL